MLKVSELYIYPIKSLGGIAVSSALVTDRGFRYDRRWMLIDEDKYFLTQRQVPKAALLKVELAENGVYVTCRTSGQQIVIPYQPVNKEPCEVFIWDDTCTALYVSDEADEWLSRVLGVKCRLVYMPDESRRQVSTKYAGQGHITSFSDGYPILLIGQASLDDLNSRLTSSLLINRFRPNIVFTGGKPYEEDLMNNFTIGGIQFWGVKLCSRCVITTIDQTTAVKIKEPLKTLAVYRTKNNEVYFGQNLVHRGNGIISVGDSINVATYHNDERFII